jgi:hypothetical protein
MGDWISVKKQLPLTLECAKDENSVLSEPIWAVGYGIDDIGNALESEDVHVAQYYFPLDEFWEVNTTNPIFGVTYWKPIKYPALPTKDTDQR